MSERVPSLSLSTDVYGSYCLQILDNIVSEYTVTEDSILRRFECNLETNEFLSYERKNYEEEWSNSDLSRVIFNDTIDLSNEGDRWEGSSLLGKPYGFGCIYNADNNIIYKGFYFHDLKMCWGVTFFSNSNLVEYRGNLFDNKRHGFGTLYDLKGNIVYDGSWIADHADYTRNMSISQRYRKSGRIHLLVEELRIGRDSLNRVPTARFNHYPFLTLLSIEDQCYRQAKKLFISNCGNLKTIIINKWCFDSNPEVEVVISYCELLQSIKIGHQSFRSCKNVVFKSLPQCKIISLGKLCFMGDELSENNKLVICNLPKLVSLQSEGGSFANYQILYARYLSNYLRIKLPNYLTDIGDVKKPFERLDLSRCVISSNAFENFLKSR